MGIVLTGLQIPCSFIYMGQGAPTKGNKMNTITSRQIRTDVKAIMWATTERVYFEAKTDEEVIFTGSTANTDGFIRRANRQLSNANILHDGWNALGDRMWAQCYYMTEVSA